MTKRMGVWAVMALGLLMAGCIVPSVYPFYTEKDLKFDPALVGSWTEDANNQEFWKFEANGTNAYDFSMNKPTETNRFSAHLFTAGGHVFLDCLYLQDVDAGIPPHYVAKVVQIQPTLKLATLNIKWTEEYLKAHPGALRHTTVRDKPDNADTEHLVLTAEPKELQKFLLAHYADTNAFIDIGEMKRK